MESRLILALVAASTLALGGCATAPLSYQNYSATENLGTQTLQTGVVIRTMPIEIRDSAAPNANGTMGGIGGGAIGYAVGGNAIGAILGFVGGMLVGHALTPRRDPRYRSHGAAEHGATDWRSRDRKSCLERR